MMKKLLIFVIIYVIIFSFIECNNDDCNDENEFWNSCGSKCPDTCLNRFVKNRACIKMCQPGCFCKPGFIRIGHDMTGGNGRCIPIDDCDKFNL